ncbi:MAG: hypothetical protein ACXVCD_15045 [Pseudobdellovibrionaceae bacterium]
MDYLFIFGIFLFCQAISTVCDLFVARFCFRCQNCQSKYPQVLVGFFSFMLGIILGLVVSVGAVLLIERFIGGVGFGGILTIYFWLQVTSALQSFINFFVVYWNIFKKKTLIYSRWQMTLFMSCGLAALIIVRLTG